MTRLLPSPRHAGVIARVELRRQWRKATSSRAKLAAHVVVGVFFLAFAAAAAFGGYFAGEAVASGSVDDPVTPAGYAAGAVMAFGAFIAGIRGFQETGEPDEPALLLTTVPHRDVVGGLLLAEIGTQVALFGLPAAVAAVAFAVGAGSPLSLVLVPVGLLLPALFGALVGYDGSLAVKNVLVRSEFVAAHKGALGVLAVLAYVGLLVSNSLGAAFALVVEPVRASPVGWFADLALLAVAPGASPVRAVGAVAFALVALVVGVAVAVRLAEWLWYADRAQPEERGTPAASKTSTVAGGLLGGRIDRPTAWVARRAWLQTRRNPIKAVFVFYPLFVAYGPVATAFETGSVPATLPPAMALYGAWATGALFALNPFGDEGAVLPVTVISGVGGRRFVRGTLLPGLAVGLPVTLALTVGAGVLSPLALSETLLLAGAATALCFGAAGIAVGAGTAFPKFERTSVTRSRKVVMPGLYAFGAYSLVLVVLASPGLGAVALPALGLLDGGPPGVAVVAAGAGLTALLAGGAGFLGYRYAAGRFDEYTVA